MLYICVTKSTTSNQTMETYTTKDGFNITKISKQKKGSKDPKDVVELYSAEKDGVKANNFYAEKDAVSYVTSKLKALSINNENSQTNKSINNNQKQPKMDKEQMKKDLALAEKSLSNPAVVGDPVMKASLEKQIAKFKAELGVEKAPAKAVAKAPLKVVAKAKAKATVKEKAPAKDKAAPKVKESKDGLVVDGFGVGVKVSFISRETDKKRTGTIVKIEKCHGREAYNAFVETSDGKQ